MMTPHQLINLPGYGSANKVVKAMGYWITTMDDTERIEWLAENVETIRRLDHMQSWKITVNGYDYDSYFFRSDIDEYATAHMQGLYRAHLEDCK